MNAYPIGLSGLFAGQRGLDVTGQNLANASTPGYHRQIVKLASVTLDGRTGLGVEVQRVARAEAPVVHAGLLTANGEAGRLSAHLASERQAETVLASGDGSIGDLLGRFFNQVDLLRTRPESATVRRVLLSSASDLARRFNATATDLDRLRAGLREQVGQTVAQVNALTPRIAELNSRIAALETAGGQANDLKDQRDQLVTDLSHLIDVRTIAQPNGVVNVVSSGALVVGTIAGSLTVTTGPSGSLVLTAAGSTAPLTVRGGTLGGLLTEHNTTLPAYRERLDAMARSLIGAVNTIHATGLTGGPSAAMVGTQSVNDSSVPLATAGLPLPIQAGTLALSVTDLATGARTLVPIAIDPTTDSLDAVATAITTATGGQVQATVDSATGTLRLQGQAGFAFDFAGRLPTSPTPVAMGGTAVPTVSGFYSGTTNDNFSFSVLGNGTIGTTAGLQLEVRNAANTVIATLNVGAGYTPGTQLAVAEGVTVALSAGTSNNGTFAIPVTGQPDTTGFLAALGLNGMLTGEGAADVAVRADLLADPMLLAVGRTGQPGDASNLERLSGLRDGTLLAGGTQTLAQFFDALVGDVGTGIQSFASQEFAVDGLRQNLTAQEQSIVGVDVNEETVALMQYQRMVEISSRYLAVVNSALDAVIGIVR